MEPLKKLAIERQKLKGKGVNRSHSLYWDILFLAFTVIGRENIDHGKGTQSRHTQVYETLLPLLLCTFMAWCLGTGTTLMYLYS
jgi:hypothetical protein